MIAIIFDTETTGLIRNEATPLSQQPQIIELGAVKVDVAESMRSGNLTVIDTFSALVNPGVPLPEIITKITGLKDEDLAEAPSFIEVLPSLQRFFLGAGEMMAHNARFDLMMLVFELRRCGKEFQFPFCPALTDTLSFYPGKLANWAKEVKGEAFVQTHRAVDDARVLADCWWSQVGPR